MHFSHLALVSVFVEAVLAVQSKNFIYIVPDGYGPASQTLARDYASLLINGENPKRPVTYQLPVDKLIIGTVRTQASDSLVTDSAASATAFACGVKTYNAAIGVDDSVQPVGSILEAAHLQGFKTGLIATSRITHATPACYAAHVAHRDSEAKIAEHEVGYGHPLGQTVDILLGGGRGFFIPQNHTGSSRKDNLNLLEYAKSQGYAVHTDRKGFELLRNGLGQAAKLPYMGLYTNSHMSYELDRNPALEPSLLEMAEAAINTLHTATKDSKKGYFLMIEASRIDHAAHSNDPVGHLHDTLMYNKVVDYVRMWINRHPETQMLSAADHECGGLTLVQEGYNPLILKAANATVEALASKFSRYTGNDAAGFLRSDVYPAYGISNPTSAEVAQLVPLKGSSNFGNALGRQISARASINWATAQHSAVDISLFGYAAGDDNKALRAEMGGNWDNTQLPGYIEKAIGVRVKDATTALRKDGTSWVGKRDLAMEKRSEHHHM